MKKLVRWLHLSDFHVGMDAYGQRILFTEICEHLRDRIKDNYSPDFVFITGDLADKGRQAEYSEFFDQFLDPMLKSLGSSWSGKIFAVPGNHDVERSRAPYFTPAHILEKPGKVFDRTADGRIAREQFALRFKNYSTMDFTGSPREWLESEAGAYALKIPVGNTEIGLVGINTAWFCKDDGDRHSLTPGVNLVADALEEVKALPLKIVLGHHPLNWLEDEQAQQLSLIFGKHSVLYLHGHLHVNDSRYDDGGKGQFLGIRCGSAFQGRADDKPPSVNGLLWADVDLENGRIELQPFHWSAHHREWKLTTEAFPNSFLSGDKWIFPLPGRRQEPAVLVRRYLPKSGPAAEPERTNNNSPPGWTIVDSDFLSARAADETSDRLLQFFDGRPPTWRLAMSASVPSRGAVEHLKARFRGLDGSNKPTIVNLLGPGGEGKSTVFLQALAGLIRQDGWVALWRHNDLEKIDWKQIRRVAHRYDKLLVDRIKRFDPSR